MRMAVSVFNFLNSQLSDFKSSLEKKSLSDATRN